MWLISGKFPNIAANDVNMVIQFQREYRSLQQICPTAPAFHQGDQDFWAANRDHQPRKAASRAQIDQLASVCRQRGYELLGMRHSRWERQLADRSPCLNSTEDLKKGCVVRGRVVRGRVVQGRVVRHLLGQ